MVEITFILDYWCQRAGHAYIISTGPRVCIGSPTSGFYPFDFGQLHARQAFFFPSYHVAHHAVKHHSTTPYDRRDHSYSIQRRSRVSHLAFLSPTFLRLPGAATLLPTRTSIATAGPRQWLPRTTRELDHIHSLLKFLNYNLEEDQSYMFTISIFFEQELISRPSGHRISIYNHAPDMKRLISKVVSKNFWEPVVRKKHSAVELGDEDQKEDVDESAMLILVSGSGKLRDEIRKHAQPYLARDIVLKELDFLLE
ncbi:uncharacterized protein JN550_013828 [Neoarthrinium moseri]|uniref:uncharacterized protein n=1 Tax=Neoarthrinium moseri TaxID=1658444 RepID=UPI001FDC213C|nr:uncharacterized protein JN550_013828 [Neoarthrinium moseri]KAI1856342.1 hypothetical protein JN550_013828 [Neoarthrinium moseri]